MKINLDFKQIKEYLSLNTTLDINSLFSEKSRAQIFKIYLKVKQIKEVYPDKIIMFFNAELNNRNYLKDGSYYIISGSDLFTNTDNHTIKARKKVVSLLTNQKCYQKGHKAIESTPLNQLCADAILFLEREPEILSSKEIEDMYGPDYSSQELLNKGILLEEIEYKPQQEVDRYEMIDEILSSLDPKNENPFLIEELLILSKEELKKKYESIQSRHSPVKSKKRLDK